jgi:hypothetical protein
MARAPPADVNGVKAEDDPFHHGHRCGQQCDEENAASNSRFRSLTAVQIPPKRVRTLMDTASIILELKAERDRVHNAITALRGITFTKNGGKSDLRRRIGSI